MTDPTIKVMDKAACRTITAAMRDALSFVEETYGVKIEIGGGSYEPSVGVLRPKVTVSLEDSDRKEFALYASSYGLEPSDFGRSFVSGGNIFTVSGVAPRSPRFPILTTSRGRTFKFAAASVKRLLAKEVAS